MLTAIPVGVGGVLGMHHVLERRRFERCPGCGARALELGPSGLSTCRKCDATFPTLPPAQLRP